MNATAKDDFDQGPNYIILDECNKFEEYVSHENAKIGPKLA